MKHEYAEMIKAKVDNMDLVLLVKTDGEWRDSSNDLPVSNGFDYFLCHPKHETAVRHALNGGSIELRGMVIDREVTDFNPTHWSKGLWYMRDDFESSIKPKKEKRWIVAKTLTLKNGESDWCLVLSDIHKAKDVKRKLSDLHEDLQIIEIEIEVD